MEKRLTADNMLYFFFLLGDIKSNICPVAQTYCMWSSLCAAFIDIHCVCVDLGRPSATLWCRAHGAVNSDIKRTATRDCESPKPHVMNVNGGRIFEPLLREAACSCVTDTEVIDLRFICTLEKKKRMRINISAQRHTKRTASTKTHDEEEGGKREGFSYWPFLKMSYNKVNSWEKEGHWDGLRADGEMGGVEKNPFVCRTEWCHPSLSLCGLHLFTTATSTKSASPLSLLMHALNDVAHIPPGFTMHQRLRGHYTSNHWLNQYIRTWNLKHVPLLVHVMRVSDSFVQTTCMEWHLF